MSFDSRDAGDFGAFIEWVFNAIAAGRASDAVWVGFLWSVGADNADIGGFFVFWNFEKGDKYNCVCACLHVLVSLGKSA